MKVNLEKTDLFNGEPNYAWVHRNTIEVPDDISDLKLIRLAKKWADWSGIKCRKEDFGDTIALYPQKSCQVLFINIFYE